MLPSMMLAWGSVTLLQCAVYNWGGLLACRLLMGLFEAGFMAGNGMPLIDDEDFRTDCYS